MSKLLIYDADCPICRVYTKGLVAAGALPASSRIPSHAVTDPNLLAQLDTVRRRHEIPLLDTQTGEARYGIDALLTVLQSVWPRFTQFVRDTVLFGLARRFYAFVSYNRRLLFPTPPERPHIMDLTPDFNVAYRVVFLVLLFGTLLTGHLAAVGSVEPTTLVMLAVQLLLTTGYTIRHSSANRLAHVLDYLGHLGMSMLVGGLAKSAGFALDWPALLLVGNAVMLWQHAARLRVMQLPVLMNLPFALAVLFNA